MDDPLLLTVRETSVLLRISRNRTYELIGRGEIPAIRLGRSIRVSRDALEEWLVNRPLRKAGQADPAALG